MKIIDSHAHFICEEYKEFLKKHNALNEDVMPLPEFSEERLLKFLEEGQIESICLSVSSPQPYFEDDVEGSIEMCHFLNEKMAQLKEKYPNRIRFHAILPLPNVEASIQEAIYAIDVLKCDGIKMASNSRGLYLGDSKLDPLMEVLNQRNCVMNIHPHKPEPMANTYTEDVIPLFEFLVDTTRAVLNMGGHQFFEKYPNIKVVVPHCGSFLPMIVERGQGLLPLMHRLGVLDYPLDMQKMMKTLYFDIAGYSKENFELLLRFANPTHIVYGSDFPFTPEVQILKQLEKMKKDLKEYSKIFYENSLRLYE